MTEKQDKNAEQIGLEIRSTFNILQKAVDQTSYKNPQE